MIILGNLEQTKYIPKSFDSDLINKIKEKLKILDDSYGPLRIYSREGGFVAVIENFMDYISLRENNFLDISQDVPEIIENIGDYAISTYIVGTEFTIVLVENTKKEFRKKYLDAA